MLPIATIAPIATTNIVGVYQEAEEQSDKMRRKRPSVHNNGRLQRPPKMTVQKSIINQYTSSKHSGVGKNGDICKQDV